MFNLLKLIIMAIMKIYPPVRPLDPAYITALSNNLSQADLNALKMAVEKYNDICVKAAEELNEFCIKELKLPPEGFSKK
jgi:hypothetical protein